MERSKIVAGIVAVFLSGIIIGAAGAAFYLKNRMFEMLDHPPKPSDEFIVQKLTEDLGLSAKQRQAAQEIVITFSKKMHEEISGFKPRLDAILDEMTAQLKTHLDPAQQKKLDEIVARIKSQKGPPPGGPFGPPPGGPDGPGGFGGPPPPGLGGPPPGGFGGPPPAP